MAGDLTILALDTSTRVCSAALLAGEHIAAEILIHGHKNHSEHILVLVDDVLQRSRISLEQIDLIAVSTGPGSFTGLRVGISTAQGLALALDKELFGVSSLAVLAFQAGRAPGHICPMIAARAQHIYTCLYTATTRAGLKKVTEETAVDPEQWIAQVPVRTLFVGEAAFAFREQIENSGRGHRLGSGVTAVPRASSLACIARELYGRAGKKESGDITPLYIRPPDAAAGGRSRRGSFNPIR